VVLIGLVLRVWVVLHLQDTVVNGDGLGYFLQAAANAGGHWFLNPLLGTKDALHPPAWVLVLTGLNKVGLTSSLQLQLAAAALGTSTVAVVGVTGRRLGGDRVGVLAAALAALWPGFWLWERSLLSETLTLLLVAGCILSTYRLRDRPTVLRAVALGALLGLLVLTRTDEVLAAAALTIGIVVGLARPATRSLRRTAAIALTVAAVGAAVIAPWIVYNSGRFDHRVLLSNGLGNVIGGSYCPGSFYGPLTGSYVDGCVYLRLKNTKGDQSVQDLALRHDAWNYARQHLGRLPVVVLAREGRAFGLYAPFQQNDREAAFQNAPLWELRGEVIGLWLLALPAVAGVVALRRRRIPIYPLVTFVAVVVAAAALTDGQARYRAAANVPIVLFAAVGIDAALRWWSRRRQARVASEAGEPRPTSAPSSRVSRTPSSSSTAQ
jgi:4-amino-4-deoxy-L-arabinose transferase-like glycosyltransferase